MAAADTQPHLWVSVVPFAAAVNIGNTHTGWLVAGSLNQARVLAVPLDGLRDGAHRRNGRTGR